MCRGEPHTPPDGPRRPEINYHSKSPKAFYLPLCAGSRSREEQFYRISRLSLYLSLYLSEMGERGRVASRQGLDENKWGWEGEIQTYDAGGKTVLIRLLATRSGRSKPREGDPGNGGNYRWLEKRLPFFFCGNEKVKTVREMLDEKLTFLIGFLTVGLEVGSAIFFSTLRYSILSAWKKY